jgi:hypothetical protein
VKGIVSSPLISPKSVGADLGIRVWFSPSGRSEDSGDGQGRVPSTRLPNPSLWIHKPNALALENEPVFTGEERALVFAGFEPSHGRSTCELFFREVHASILDANQRLDYSNPRVK